MNLEHVRTVLENAGVIFEAGLSSKEIEHAEGVFDFIFPEDLRRFLMFALPTGLKFPNWRNVEDQEIVRALSWPLEGIWSDVQHNGFWLPEWGPKPNEESEAYERLRRRVADAPTLIPISGHRYIPDRPHTSGNPVLSVFQTDIIYYGTNLENYLHNEFSYYFQTPRHSIEGKIRHIDFWSELVG